MTYLGPYISRGVISTKTVFQHLLYDSNWAFSEKLIQELAWRDYWQQVWIHKKEAIYSDLKNEQSPIDTHEMPDVVLNATTGIESIDHAIKNLYTTGYMHNHMRMYVASICCNIANCHWRVPADWLYGHLLDGDVASNYLSWQWVAGAFSNKKYFANQKNINRFFESEQKDTFLDVGYNTFENFETPAHLKETSSPTFNFRLPKTKPSLDATKQTLVYNYYNLDPYWHKGEDFQRVLLLEPSLFEKHPVSQKCIDFVLKLAENIDGIQLYTGSFEELAANLNGNLYFKEHPTNSHYRGIEEPRDWISSVKGYYPSFFKFWKQVKKEIKH